MTRMLGVVITMVLAGCMESTPPPNGPTGGPPGTASADNQGGPDEMVCTEETPTGSMISRKVCRKKSDVEAERQANQDALSTPKTNVPPARHP